MINKIQTATHIEVWWPGDYLGWYAGNVKSMRWGGNLLYHEIEWDKKIDGSMTPHLDHYK